MLEQPVDPNDIDVEDWISGTSYVQTTVTIPRNLAIWAEYEPVLAGIAALEQELNDLLAAEAEDEVADESSLGETSSARRSSQGEESLGEAVTEDANIGALRRRLAELQAQASEIYERFMADSEVWHLRALDVNKELPELQAEAAKVVPLPAPLRPLGKGATAKQKAAYLRREEVFRKGLEEAATEMNLHSVAAATLKVVVGGVEKPAPSVEGLRKLRQRPYGESHFQQLWRAVERITLQEVEVPAPHRSGS